MIKQLTYCLVISIVAFGCKTSSVISSTDTEKYKEDLSQLRPKYEKPEVAVDSSSTETVKDFSDVSPTNDVTAKLDAILDEIDELRKDISYIDGFTIQVYSGTNSEEARLARGKVYSILPESSPKLKFDEPNFKVKVGEYYSRIEARRSYSQLKKKFPGAIIIPQRIYLH
ncbi:SPOR domain-containing protein [Fulvivirga sp. 29W222]|uniref:SPOR domain-containing protein n=1 Tax=Fulvivirga marina TaxID=2494733 RepID=A0A937KGZ2_9BACT|nr:SPOR domain-containing protein [Fulvivirga marina]MBL6449673.1 SPOR domain-containing protein [Fulvivirga marina]